MFVKNITAVLYALAASVLLSSALNYFSVLVTPDWYISLLFLTLFCLIYNLICGFQTQRDAFTGLLIGGIVAKLLLSLAVLVIYSTLRHSGFLAFALHFMGHYILFTIFEIRYLSQLIKNDHTNT